VGWENRDLVTMIGTKWSWESFSVLFTARVNWNPKFDWPKLID